MKSKKGFTLIELLAVIAIMAILSTIVVVQITGSKEKARDNQRKADLLKIATALEFYRTDNKSYPSNISTEPNTVLNSGLKDALVPTYLPSMPTDPKNLTSTKYDQQYQYVSSNSGNTPSKSFSLYAVLEKPSAEDLSTPLPAQNSNPGSCPNHATSTANNFAVGYVAPTFAVIGNCTK